MPLTYHNIGAEARRIWALAWPVTLTSLNWTLLHLTDVAIVGHAGTDELGALGAGRSLTYISSVMGMAALAGVLVHVSRAEGAGDSAKTGHYLRQGVIYSIILGIICTVIMYIWAKPLVAAAGIAPEMVDGGADVVRAMALAYPFQFIMAAASYFLEGVSRPRRVLIVNLATLPLNAILAWAWVGGHLGFPERGAAGASLATATVSAFGAVGMLAAAWMLPDAAERGLRNAGWAAWRAAWRAIPALFKFGLVPAIASGLELAGFSWLIVLSTQLGAATAAAFQLVFSLHNLTFALSLGFGSAAGVRVGNAYGAGETGAVFKRTMIAAGLAFVAMGLFGAVLFTFADAVAVPFTEDLEVRRLAVMMLLLLAPFMFLDGVQMVMIYALRSLGDQIAAGINGIIGFFIVTGGLGWLLVRMGYGAPGLIYAAVAGMIVASLLQTARLLLVTARLRRQS
jgi:MATE family multidrug resistance protein